MPHNTREVEGVLLKLKEYNLTVSSPHQNQDDEQIFVSIIHHQLQKARQEWLREEIVRLGGMKMHKDKYQNSNYDTYANYCRDMGVHNKPLQTIIARYNEELDQLNK